MSFVRANSEDYFGITYFVRTISILEENYSTDCYFTENILDFNKSLRWKFHYRTHIERGQPKRSSRNTVSRFRYCSLFHLHFSYYIIQVSRVAFYVFHRSLLVIVKL